MDLTKQKNEFEALFKRAYDVATGNAISLIEGYLCHMANEKAPIYDVTHRDDPAWDSSGELVKRNECLSVDSDMTLRDISDCYTGQKEASYSSGNGWFYKTYADECWWLINDFVSNLAVRIIERCVEKKLYVDYIEESVGTAINDKDFIESDFVYEKMNDAPIYS